VNTNLSSSLPLVVHLIYKLDFGGLETIVLEQVNHMDRSKYRHAIICITDYTDFAKKIEHPDVQLFALHKAPGLSLDTHVKLWKLLRQLRPAILHTYNLSAVEYVLPAMLSGVPARINGSHGRDSNDLQGTNKKHNFLRRALLPFYDTYYAVSTDLQVWLRNVIRVPENKNRLIVNGVNTEKFCPPNADAITTRGPKIDSDCFVIGTVGRVQEIKNHLGLVDAFIALLALYPEQRAKLRLVIVGDGPLFATVKAKVEEAGIADLVWLPGSRTDIAEIMRAYSIFALSSVAEGMPVTILEAMSCGLPIIATAVGGIPEVVQEGQTGFLVPASNAAEMAAGFARYLENPALIAQHGATARNLIEQKYSMKSMVAAYQQMYDDMPTH